MLDRFLFKIKMGYPTTEEGVKLLNRFRDSNPLAALTAVAGEEIIQNAQKAYSSVTISDEVVRYLLSIVEKTRMRDDVAVGVSPRGSQALLRAAQVHAILDGRDYVAPDDIKAMAKPTLCHRIALRGISRMAGQAERIIDDIIGQTEVPAEADLSVR